MIILKTESKKVPRNHLGLSVVLSVWAACSLMVNQTLYQGFPSEGTFLQGMAKILDGNVVMSCVALCGSWYVIRKCMRGARPFSRGAAVCAAILSLFSVIGDSMTSVEGGTLDWMLSGALTPFLVLLVFLGRSILLYSGIVLLFARTDRWLNETTRPGAAKVWTFVFDEHYRLCIPVVLILCWSVYYISLFPGYVGYDIQAQLDVFYGYAPLTAHHPVLSTLINGAIFDLGRALHSDNLGCFLAIAFQSGVLIFAITRLFGKMRDWRAPYLFRGVTLFFFAVFTVWPFWADTWDKDTLYTAVFMLFYIELLDLTENRKRIWAFITLSVLLCLLRNNGVLIWAFSVIPLWILLAKRKETHKKKKLIGASAVVVFVLILATVGQQLCGVQRGGIQEALSVPFQQTARCVKEDGETLTDSDWNRLSKVFSNSETLGEDYQWWYSDPVKNHYRFAWGETTTDEQQTRALLSYAKVWLQLFLKHPVTYMEAAFAHTYMYYDIDSVGMNIYYGVVVPNEHYELYRASKYDSLQYKVFGVTIFMSRAPGTGLLYCPGFYTWILLIGLTYMIVRREKDGIVAALPLIMNVIVCILSPVNGNIRYALPLMGCIPLFLAFILRDRAQTDQKER